MQDFFQFVANHFVLWGAWLILLGLFFWTEFRTEVGGVRKLSPQETVQMMNHQHALLLDLRDKEIFNQSHILNSKWASLQELSAKTTHYKRLKTHKILILVHSNDQQSLKAAEQLKQQGFENVNILKNGLSAWTEAGMPVVKA
jgi:rhodanese-related sulfurtransferase